MIRHNPGPWRIMTGAGRNGSLITILDADGVRVASILRQYRPDPISNPPYDDFRRLCNAELINAAPVMFKAITDYLSEKNITRDGLRFALAAVLGDHPPDRQCDCLECFDYFFAPPPPCSNDSAHHDGRS